MRRYLSLFKILFNYSLISDMAYPIDFITWAVVDFLWAIINIGFFKILLLNIPSITGWNFSQLVIPLGIFSLLNAFIWGTLYGNMREVARAINKGDLDLVLTKPVSSQFMVSLRHFGIGLFPSILTGVFLIGYGFYLNHIHPLYLFIFPPILASSLIIFYSVYFVSVCMAFWTNRLNNIAELLPHISDIARYPVEIFPVVIRFILTFIIPLGLLAVFPARIVLSLVSPVYLLFPLLMAVVLLYFSHKFWHFALRRYSSASS